MIYRWNEVAKQQLDPLVTRQAIHGAAMTVARFEIAKGGGVPAHSHVNEQISMVERGRVRYLVDGEESILGAGAAVHIPANVPHSAEVLEDAVVIDLFSPPRTDWMK